LDGRSVAQASGRLQAVGAFRTSCSAASRDDAPSRTVILDPYYRLASRTTYRVVIRAGIRDVAGNRLPAQTWTFRTGRS